MTFTERYPEIIRQVEKRRRKWDLAVMPFDDARQEILIHINEVYPSFDPLKGEFVKWVNRVISNKIKNIWRDEYTNHAKPCVLKCPFNTGGDGCSRTSTGIQSVECKKFAEWVKRRKNCHDIKQTLSLENHHNEANSIQSDFMDIGAKKRVIDEKMKERLTKTEYRVYRMVIMQGKDEKEAAAILGHKPKRGKKTKMFPGYLAMLALRHKFVAIAKEIIEEEDLA